MTSLYRGSENLPATSNIFGDVLKISRVIFWSKQKWRPPSTYFQSRWYHFPSLKWLNEIWLHVSWAVKDLKNNKTVCRTFVADKLIELFLFLVCFIFLLHFHSENPSSQKLFNSLFLNKVPNTESIYFLCASS